MLVDLDPGVPALVFDHLRIGIHRHIQDIEMLLTLLIADNNPARIVHPSKLIGLLLALYVEVVAHQEVARTLPAVLEFHQLRQRNFARADEIRDELADSGVQIEDGADGTTWRRNNG